VTAAVESFLPLGVMSVSLLAGVLIFLAGERRQALRITLNLGAAVLKLVLIGVIGVLVVNGREPEFRLALLPTLELVLRTDALSLLFSTLSAVLWLVTTVYAIAYLENSPNRARFFGFFSLCVAATMGVASAGNLFTFFLFYELLTLATWPLVVHTGTPAAFRGGRTYLRYTLSGSAVFLFAIIWLYGLSGIQDFTVGGYLAGIDPARHGELRVIFVLLMVGMGVKAALVPLHSWLPKAMVAPAPVSALLHAVAVVKAGAFGLVRLVEDVYGPSFAHDLGMDIVLAVAAAVTIIYGSTLALFQTDIKKRLAFSTVSQVSYIALGVAVGGAVATTGGMVHLVHQGLMKITLFFCAGIFGALLGVTRIDQLDGVGRRLPWSSLAFTVGALGMIGLPPIAGFVSKWHIGLGAVETGQIWVVGVLVTSTLLNAAYFLPLLKRIWLHPAPEVWPGGQPVTRPEVVGLVAPAVVTAAMALAAGLMTGYLLSPLTWVIDVVEVYVP